MTVRRLMSACSCFNGWLCMLYEALECALLLRCAGSQGTGSRARHTRKCDYEIARILHNLVHSDALLLQHTGLHVKLLQSADQPHQIG